MGGDRLHITVAFVSIIIVTIGVIPHAFAYDFEFEQNVPNTFTKNNEIITSGTDICNGIPPSTNPNFPYDSNGHKQVWVKFNQNTLPDHAAGKVYVKDKAANTDTAKIDFVCANLSSQNTNENVDVVLRETGINTGFFESIGYARFTSAALTNDYNFGPDLYSSPGTKNDVITATYANQTNHNTTDTLSVVKHPADDESGGWGNLGYVIAPSHLPNNAARVVCVDDIELYGKGDGVCDEWETGGRLSISFNGKTYTGPECGGANQDICPFYTKVDVFIEADFNGEKYTEQELDLVFDGLKGAFSGHDSGRIDPATGYGLYVPVELHIQKDSGDKNYIPEQITFPGNTDYPNGFNVTKTFYFGTDQERGGTVTQPSPTTPPPDWAFEQKSQVFHYVQYVDKIEGLGPSTGYAELWGNDMVVARGYMYLGGDTRELTGTSLHEIGHNLGLNHGGKINDDINCKPNYLSAMSYTFQMPYYLGIYWIPDFSWTQLNTMPEQGLWEPTGLWAYPNGIDFTFYWAGSNFRYALADPSIDWNGNGVIDYVNQDVDLNDLNILGCLDSPDQVLDGHQDWGSDLQYNFRFTPNFASSGLHTNPAELGEMDKDTIDDIINNAQNIGNSIDALVVKPHPHQDFGTFEAYTSDPPTIDGVEDAIWNNADTVNMKIDLPHSTLTNGWWSYGDEYDTDIKLSMMNDDENIYVKIRADGDSQIDWERVWSSFRFDVDHSHGQGSFEMDRKNLYMNPDNSKTEDHYGKYINNKVEAFDTDENLHGKNEIKYGFSNGVDWQVLEFSVPLCSNDVNDFCLETGDDIGFRYLHVTYHDDWANGDSSAQVGQYVFPGWPGSGGPNEGFHFVVASQS